MKFDISQFKPCPDAVEYYNSKESFEQAWRDCHRGDWMLWIAKKLGVDLRVLTLAKGKCAETVLHLMKDDRSVAAVKAAIDYGNGQLDDIGLRNAAADAGAAADAADAGAAADAAYIAPGAGAGAYIAAAAAAAGAAADAADAAYAAYAAAYAAAAAADAAYAAAAAAGAAADAARNKNKQFTADICREILTTAIMEKIK